MLYLKFMAIVNGFFVLVMATLLAAEDVTVVYEFAQKYIFVYVFKYKMYTMIGSMVNFLLCLLGLMID